MNGGLFKDADGIFYDPDAAAQHAIIVQGGFSTPLREAGRMIRDGGVSGQRAREWMAENGYTEADLPS
jgi:hypothetical protein